MSKKGDLKSSEQIALTTLIVDSQDIKAILEHTPNCLGYDQDTTTGALIEIKDGDYTEVWLTDYRQPYLDSAVYCKVK